MLLDKFEKLMMLKTIAGSVDYNFIGVNDLEEIAYIAEEHNIDLPEFDLDGLYNDQYSDLVDIHKAYCDAINDQYSEVRQQILQAMNQEEK